MIFNRVHVNIRARLCEFEIQPSTAKIITAVDMNHAALKKKSYLCFMTFS